MADSLNKSCQASPTPASPDRVFSQDRICDDRATQESQGSWQTRLGLCCCVLAFVAGTLVAALSPRPPRPVDPIPTGQSGLPFVGAWQTALSRRPHASATPPSSYRGGADEESSVAIAIAEAFTVAWFFVVGAAIGSFLNVVAYRLPRGMNLSRPKSHCPTCGHRIRRSDNLPIIGWLKLRGPCRDCGSRISLRYPLVEAAIGVLFVGMVAQELLSGGANLPVRRPNVYAGVVWALWYTKWDLVAIYFYHAFLLATLASIALIANDSVRMPRKLIAVGLAVGLVAPLFAAGLRPVGMGHWGCASGELVHPVMPNFTSVFRIPNMEASLAILAEGLVGGMVGLLGGFLVREGTRPRLSPGSAYSATPLLLAMVGTYLGWQAAVSVALMAALLAMVFLAGVPSLPRRWRPRWEWLLGAAALLQILFWRRLDSIDRWPPSAMTPNAAAFAVATLAVSTLTTRVVTSRISDDD
jgi:leader peptidase (prepilin peptidase)/N-methyltransferase